jgi:ribosomal protein L19
MHKGKTLINEIEKEYKESIKSSRPFKVPNYR